MEAVEAAQQKADPFLHIFLSQQKKKNGSTASTFRRVSPLFSRGVRFWLWLDGVVLAIYS
ncbi:hypothetical protein QF021_002265 [Acidovorax delafieldii]|uniref:hypothetical protein n=1 Tax=Acidovorax delafieldii TaxID=47920 RepID=UPI0028599CE0|nr:hypothetical protein [Acidovorax delafieldii]MDR6154176.1 hypothetical protein [Acidovorax delafieldii]